MKCAVLLLLGAGLLAAQRGESFRFRTYAHPGVHARAVGAGPQQDLWLAAAEGLFSFDGVRFTPLPAFPFSTAHLLAADAGTQTIWVGSAQGLARFAQGKFEIEDRAPLLGLASDGADALVVTDTGFYRLTPDGRRTELTPRPHLSPIVDEQGDAWYAGPLGGYRLRRGATQGELIAPLPAQEAREAYQFAPGRPGEYWFGRRNTVFRHGTTRRLSRNTQHIGLPVLPNLLTSRGRLWYLGDGIEDLTGNANYRPHELDSSPSVAYVDRQGRLWRDFSDNSRLTEIIPEAGWERWPASDFHGQTVRSLAREANGGMLATANDGLYRLNADTRTWTRVAAATNLWSLLPLPDGTILAATLVTDQLMHFSRDGRLLHSAPIRCYELALDAKGRILVGAAAGLFRLDDPSGSFRLVPLPINLQGHEPLQSVRGIQPRPDGRLWLAAGRVLGWIDASDVWSPLDVERSVGEIRDFAVSPDGNELWLCNRNRGVFYRLRRDGVRWRARPFPADEGYLPPATQRMLRDRRHWTLRGTPESLQITDGAHVAPHEWLVLNGTNGMTSSDLDQHSMLEDGDGSLWMTGAGVTHFSPRPEWFKAPRLAARPRLTLAQLNDQAISPPREAPGAYDLPVHRLLLNVASLDASAFRATPFLYRLLPRDTAWRPAPNSSIELRDLATGAYRLEIAYTANQPAAALTYHFRVDTFWTRWPWGWILGGAGGLGALGWLMRRTVWVERVRYRFARRLHRSRHRASPAEFVRAIKVDQTVGRYYRLERVLATGGLSTVYDGLDTRTSQRVAVKLLEGSTAETPWVKERYAREVTALRTVQHPGVLPLLDAWIEPDGQPCMVTPLLLGPTLRELLRTGPLAEVHAAELTGQLGSALAEVHRRGIVHRDLKPENVLVTSRDGHRQAVLIDFGNAAPFGRDEGLAQTKVLAGTVYYMAPEQFSMHYSAASDVYSLGVVILEMLTGKRLADLSVASASPGFAEELTQTLADAGLPKAAAMAEVLGRAFVPDPLRRPVDAGAWTAELAALLRAR